MRSRLLTLAFLALTLTSPPVLGCKCISPPPGLSAEHLVYASVDASGQLSTDICSGTGLLEERRANLAYLRGEPIPSESIERHKTRATGNLCGRLVGPSVDFSESRIFLRSIDNKSPVPSDEAELANDGSFCATDLIPGKYYLMFVNRDGESPTSFVFFPGVANSLEATPIAVKSGEANSKLLFKVPPQPTFSVSGNVLMSNKSALPAECKVALFNADPLSFVLAYGQEVAHNGSFEFPRVLPGKYWAFVSVESEDARRWLTRKVVVDVGSTVNNLQLELIAK